MDHQDQIIYLIDQPEDRLIRKLALFTFKRIRYIASQARQAPSHILQISSDVKDAWRESAIPKA